MTNSKTSKLPNDAKQIIADQLGASAPASDASSASTEVAHPVRTFFADPVYAGGLTWLGTILAVIAAWQAWVQARRAIRVVAAVKSEQARKHTEVGKQLLDRLNQEVKPIVHGSVQRGVDVAGIVKSSSPLCHEILTTPAVTTLPELKQAVDSIADALKNIESALHSWEYAVKAAKNQITPAAAQAQSPITVAKDAAEKLQGTIKSELQRALVACTTDIEIRATPQN